MEPAAEGLGAHPPCTTSVLPRISLPRTTVNKEGSGRLVQSQTAAAVVGPTARSAITATGAERGVGARIVVVGA